MVRTYYVSHHGFKSFGSTRRLNPFLDFNMRTLHPSARRSAARLFSHEAIDPTEISLRLLRLIQAFRIRGHFAASLDPLTSSSRRNKIERKAAWLSEDPSLHPDIVKLLRHYPRLDLTPFGLQEVPLDQRFYVGRELRGPMSQSHYSIQEIVQFMKKVYCGNVGVEISHIENSVQREWLLQQFSSHYGPTDWSVSHSKESKLKVLSHLMECDHTAQFFNRKFPSAKVFGLEGCESLIPGLWSALETACSLNIEGIEMGMAHRGRMNVLHNIFRISLKKLCNKFGENELHELGIIELHPLMT